MHLPEGVYGEAASISIGDKGVISRAESPACLKLLTAASSCIPPSFWSPGKHQPGVSQLTQLITEISKKCLPDSEPWLLNNQQDNVRLLQDRQHTFVIPGK